MSITTDNPGTINLGAMPGGVVDGQAMYALQPVSPQADGDAQSSVRTQAILSALRRRWMRALGLGLLLGGIAAAVAWYVIPDSYTAFAELIVDPEDTFIYSDRDTRERAEPLDVYKQTRIRLAKYPFVLSAALRDPDVARCPTIREQEHPEEWLAKAIEVDSPAAQFIRISLTSPNAADSARIVNSVVTAFEREVVDKGRLEKLANLEELRSRLRKEQSKLDNEIQELRRLDKEVSTANQVQADLRIEALYSVNIELRKQLSAVEWEILQKEIELESLKTQPAREVQQAAVNPVVPDPKAKDAPLIADAKGAGDVADEPRVADGTVAPPKGAADSTVSTTAGKTDAPEGDEASVDADMLEIEIPEIPDDIVESHLVNDPEYIKKEDKLNFENIQLGLYEKRFSATNSRVQERRERVSQQQAELDEYRAEQFPLIREKLMERLRAEMTPPPSPALPPAAAVVDQEAPEAEVPPTPPVDPTIAVKKSLGLLHAMRDRIQKELEERVMETKDFGSLWVDREIKAEDIDKLKGRVDGLSEILNARQVESEYEEKHPPIEVRRRASVPMLPERGLRIKLAGASGLGLFGLVFMGIVYLEHSAHRLNSVNEVQSELNLQVVSSIPLMPRWLDADGDPNTSQKSAYWHSVLTESVDAMRTVLLRHAQLHSTKVVMIASAIAGEGKTTLSCHLATSLARAGRRVLLIDGDIRRPNIHRVFDVDGEVGLCECLTDQVELMDAVHDVSPAGLSVLPAGDVDADTLRALAQDKLGQLLDVARQKYDFVVLDTSPVLPVTDALLMSQFADVVLFSLRRDVSRATKVSAAVQRLSMLGINVLGAVAIGLDEGPSQSRYSYYNANYGYQSNPHLPTASSNGQSHS